MNNDLVDLQMFISEYNGYKPMMWTNEKASIATDRLSWAIEDIVKRNTNNREIMLEAIKFNASYVRDVGNELINSESFVLEAYNVNQNILSYLNNVENLERFKETLVSQKNQESNFQNSNEVSNKKI